MCTEDLESTEDFEEIGDDSVDEVVDEGIGEEAEAEAPDPWAWAEGKNPADIEKTYTKFTQRTQDLSDTREGNPGDAGRACSVESVAFAT